MDLSIIIVSYNTKELTKACISSVIRHTKGIRYEIIVIDNVSSDGSQAAIRKLETRNPKSEIKFVENKENVGFGGGNNIGIKKAKGKYLLFLNPDTLVHDNLLSEMIEWMDKRPEVGVASCALKNEDGSMQGTGGYFPSLLRVFSWMTIQDLPLVDKLIKPFHPMKEKSFSRGQSLFSNSRELDWITGAYMLFRKEAIDQVGGFDEGYFMYTEEVDLCYRTKKKGWKVLYNPEWEIVHYGRASGTSESSVLSEYEGVKRFYKKHYPSWQYPILRILLKIGAVGRMFLFRLLDGKEAAGVYAKAFKIA